MCMPFSDVSKLTECAFFDRLDRSREAFYAPFEACGRLNAVCRPWQDCPNFYAPAGMVHNTHQAPAGFTRCVSFTQSVHALDDGVWQAD